MSSLFRSGGYNPYFIRDHTMMRDYECGRFHFFDPSTGNVLYETRTGWVGNNNNGPQNVDLKAQGLTVRLVKQMSPDRLQGNRDTVYIMYIKPNGWTLRSDKRKVAVYVPVKPEEIQTQQFVHQRDDGRKDYEEKTTVLWNSLGADTKTLRTVGPERAVYKLQVESDGQKAKILLNGEYEESVEGKVVIGLLKHLLGDGQEIELPGLIEEKERWNAQETKVISAAERRRRRGPTL